MLARTPKSRGQRIDRCELGDCVLKQIVFKNRQWELLHNCGVNGRESAGALCSGSEVRTSSWAVEEISDDRGCEAIAHANSDQMVLVQAAFNLAGPERRPSDLG